MQKFSTNHAARGGYLSTNYIDYTNIWSIGQKLGFVIGSILRATGERISPDTLCRIWGYKKGYSSVRQSTVRVLDRYAHANEESDFIHTNAIHADECQKGDRVRIAWLPNRVCVLSYLGDYRWRVEEAVNSKLHAGDTFSCRTMAQDQALIVDHLHTKDAVYESYAIGGTNGLTFVAKI